MNEQTLRELLDGVRAGTVTTADAVRRLQTLPFEDIGVARLDHHRRLRCGFPEVVFAEGKTVEQCVMIFQRLAEHGDRVLATRASEAQAAAIVQAVPDARYNPLARTVSLVNGSEADEQSAALPPVGVVCAGTADMPVAEEARETIELFGQQVERLYDVGVAGLHRLLGSLDRLRQMNVLVVVAGMEGALASVVGGMVSAPVIAVPTSVGYGASFNGVSALLTMLNSCAPGVAVQNIDNGFGGGYFAAVVNRRSCAVDHPA